MKEVNNNVKKEMLNELKKKYTVEKNMMLSRTFTEMDSFKYWYQLADHTLEIMCEIDLITYEEWKEEYNELNNAYEKRKDLIGGK